MATVKKIFENNTSEIITATELLKSLDDRTGRHVWKMYDYEKVLASEITVTQTQGGGVYACEIKFSSDKIDFSTIDKSFFYGMTFTTSNSTVVLNRDGSASWGGSNVTWKWYPGTQKISFSVTGANGATWTITSPKSFITSKEFVTYISADDETAYPDGGELDGHFYEKLIFAYSKMNYGIKSVTGSSAPSESFTTAVKIAHGLGVVPTYVSLNMTGEIDPGAVGNYSHTGYNFKSYVPGALEWLYVNDEGDITGRHYDTDDTAQYLRVRFDSSYIYVDYKYEWSSSGNYKYCGAIPTCVLHWVAIA